MANGPILIIEDDFDIRTQLKEVLEQQGYENILVAANGAEGLDLLRNNPECRLILLDLMMPVIDGWTFLNLKANIKEYKDIPVIVISVIDHRHKQIAAVEYLRKPVQVPTLLQALSKVERESNQAS